MQFKQSPLALTAPAQHGAEVPEGGQLEFRILASQQQIRAVGIFRSVHVGQSISCNDSAELRERGNAYSKDARWAVSDFLGFEGAHFDKSRRDCCDKDAGRWRSRQAMSSEVPWMPRALDAPATDMPTSILAPAMSIAHRLQDSAHATGFLLSRIPVSRSFRNIGPEDTTSLGPHIQLP